MSAAANNQPMLVSPERFCECGVGNGRTPFCSQCGGRNAPRSTDPADELLRYLAQHLKAAMSAATKVEKREPYGGRNREEWEERARRLRSLAQVRVDQFSRWIEAVKRLKETA